MESNGQYFNDGYHVETYDSEQLIVSLPLEQHPQQSQHNTTTTTTTSNNSELGDTMALSSYDNLNLQVVVLPPHVDDHQQQPQQQHHQHHQHHQQQQHQHLHNQHHHPQQQQQQQQQYYQHQQHHHPQQQHQQQQHHQQHSLEIPPFAMLSPPPYSEICQAPNRMIRNEETRRALKNAATVPEIPKRGEISDYTGLLVLTIICFPFVIFYVVLLIKYRVQLTRSLERGDVILAKEISERIRKLCIYTVAIGTFIYLFAIALVLVVFLGTYST